MFPKLIYWDTWYPVDDALGYGYGTFRGWSLPGGSVPLKVNFGTLQP